MRREAIRNGNGSRADDERGIALVIVMSVSGLILALGMAIVLATMGDARIVANVRGSDQAFYAAEAALARVMAEVRERDWSVLLAGSGAAVFADEGPPGSVRQLRDGTRLDLDAETAFARSAPAEQERQWRLVAYGPFSRILGRAATGESPIYVLVWAGRQPSASSARGEEAGEPQILALLAHAYAPQGGRRGVRITIAREGGLPRVLSWLEAP